MHCYTLVLTYAITRLSCMSAPLHSNYQLCLSGKVQRAHPGYFCSSSAFHTYFLFCCTHVYCSNREDCKRFLPLFKYDIYKTVQELFIRMSQLRFTDSIRQVSLNLSKDQFNTLKKISIYI